MLCMVVLLFAMTTAVMGCYQKETGPIDIPGRTPSDTYIERATYELRRERRVRVATSDGPEQVIILGHGALRVSARAFHAEVEAAEGQISAVLQHLTNRPRSERTIRNNVSSSNNSVKKRWLPATVFLSKNECIFLLQFVFNCCILSTVNSK